MHYAHTKSGGVGVGGTVPSPHSISPPHIHQEANGQPKSKRLRLRKWSEGSSTHLSAFTTRLKDYLFLPDLRIVHAVYGAMAGNMIAGSPSWLMVVGPPSDGKTELLMSMLQVPGVEALHNVKGAASFLSATGAKERAKDATGGVLRKIGWHGAVIFDDFNSVLRLNDNEKGEVFDVFRQIYGGRWSRDVGSDGGKTLSWGPGKIGFLGGCTGLIDSSLEVNGTLGERFMYYRTTGYGVPDEVKLGHGVDSYEKSRRAVLNEEGGVSGGVEGWQEEMRGLVAGVFMGLGLGFGRLDRGFEKELPVRELEDREIARIITIGEVASRARSAVERDRWSKEMVGVSDTERGPRLTKALRQLYVGMEAIGVPEEGRDGRWAVLRKVAMDSMPALRRLVLEEAWRAREEKERGEGPGRESGMVGLEEIRVKVRTGKTAVARAAEDLEVHGCVRFEKVKGYKYVGLTERMWRGLKQGWGEREG